MILFYRLIDYRLDFMLVLLWNLLPSIKFVTTKDIRLTNVLLDFCVKIFSLKNKQKRSKEEDSRERK